MTIDSTYFLEKRGPSTSGDKTRYYFEFETATDSEVEVYVTLPTGNKVKLTQVEND